MTGGPEAPSSRRARALTVRWASEPVDSWAQTPVNLG